MYDEDHIKFVLSQYTWLSDTTFISISCCITSCGCCCYHYFSLRFHLPDQAAWFYQLFTLVPILFQLHPPSGGCPTGEEQSLQHQGVCYWHIAILPRTACFRRYAILRKQKLRLCWAVIAPYIWVSPCQAPSQSCWTKIQITQVWTLKILFC